LSAFDSSIFFKHKTSRELIFMKLYVGNLSFSVTEAELRETFLPFGEVAKVDLVSDRFTGESRGFGFVEMDDNSQADAAIKSLNGSDLRGRAMTVNQAKPKADRNRLDRRV